MDEVLSALVMKSFALDRAKRFASAAEMRAGLERHRTDAPLADAAAPYVAARSSQLVDLPNADGTTLPVRRGPPAISPTLLAVERNAAPLALDPDEAPLELDRPPPAAPAPVVAPSRAGGRAPLAALVVVVALLAGGAIWWFVTHPGAEAAPAPDRVQVRIADLPRAAKVFVDGAASAPSFTIAGARVPHRVRLEAPGYSDKVLLFTPDADQTLDGRMNRSR